MNPASATFFAKRFRPADHASARLIAAVPVCILSIAWLASVVAKVIG